MRRKPYTQRGIRRLKCFRCHRQGWTSWRICADGNQYRPICAWCDVALNRLVLEFMRDPDVEEKMSKYAAEVARAVILEHTG